MRFIAAPIRGADRAIAGGIAHDFNNLLQAVSGRLRLIQRRAGESEDIQTIARMALEAAERGASVTARLLSATLPVLLLTGYADESLDLDTITENGVVLLRKPVAGSKLATRAALLLRPVERADAAAVVTEAEAKGDAAGHRP